MERPVQASGSAPLPPLLPQPASQRPGTLAPLPAPSVPRSPRNQLDPIGSPPKAAPAPLAPLSPSKAMLPNMEPSLTQLSPSRSTKVQSPRMTVHQMFMGTSASSDKWMSGVGAPAGGAMQQLSQRDMKPHLDAYAAIAQVCAEVVLPATARASLAALHLCATAAVACEIPLAPCAGNTSSFRSRTAMRPRLDAVCTCLFIKRRVLCAG